MRLGIDFGTTRTVVAGIEGGNHPICAFDHEGRLREYIPTLAGVRDGEILYGWDAAMAGQRGEATLFRGLKRLMVSAAPEEKVMLDESTSVCLIDLLTGFLNNVRESIQNNGTLTLADDPLEVMIATPANANSNQRFLTIEGFRRAGFAVVESLNEPSVAALEYVQRFLRQLGKKSPKEYVVVYDLGGGTFDTSVVRFADRSFDVLCHDGISKLGGEDFDSILVDLALEEAGLKISDFSMAQMAELLEECRERKEGLTPSTKKIAVDINLPGQESTTVIDADRYYDACLPIIKPSVDSVAQLLQGMVRPQDPPEDPRRLAAVYLVGGSAVFPPVARSLREAFGRKVRHALTPFGTTAIGLAISADPKAGVKIQESSTRHFGVWREGAAGRDKLFDMLIPKDTRLAPGRGSVVVRRYNPMHNVGHLRFMECGQLDEHGRPTGDLHPWPEILFPYDPNLVAAGKLEGSDIERRPDLADQEIYETYRYDADGMLKVKIENRTSGYRRDYSLTQCAR